MKTIIILLAIVAISCESEQPEPLQRECWTCHVTNVVAEGSHIFYGDAFEDLCEKTEAEIRDYELESYVKRSNHGPDSVYFSHQVKCTKSEKR
jgi:hypothetical protein